MANYAGSGTSQKQPQTMYAQGLFDESADQKHALGTVRWTDDGRKFVYCQATAAAIAAGLCVSKAVAVQACTIAAADAAINLIGARTVTLTLTGAPTANLYRDGTLILTAGTGLGESYKIKGNTADDVPASGRCTFYLYDKLATTHVAASTTVDVIANPYDGVLINPAVANAAATTQEKVLGITTRSITASYYFWAQVRGLASMMLDVDAASGAEANEMAIIQGTTEGRGLTLADTHTPGMQILGYLMVTADADDAEAALVDLCIG